MSSFAGAACAARAPRPAAANENRPKRLRRLVDMECLLKVAQDPRTLRLRGGALKGSALPLRERRRGTGGLDELRQLADDLAQLGLLDDLRRLVRGKPAPLALAALGPYLRLLAHLQREDLDLAGDGRLRLETLVVIESSDRPLADLSAHAGLLEGFALCRHVRLAVLHRPAL